MRREAAKSTPPTAPGDGCFAARDQDQAIEFVASTFSKQQRSTTAMAAL
jgi:hypothetical protein